MFFSSDLITGSRGYDHTIVIIHTHSDDNTGDLWYTSHDADAKAPASTQISFVCVFLIRIQQF